MSKKVEKNEVATVADQEILKELAESFPTEPSALKIFLPRIEFVSQDKTEGKGKAMKVVTEAGTFIKNIQTEEVDEDGKKIWEKEEIGTVMEGIILFQRKQLRLYDESTQLYTSSPIYDTDDEVLPLFCDKKEIKRDTPANLKKQYEYVEDGKTKSKLEDNKILYVIFNGELFQLTLRGSSMWSFSSYASKNRVSTVLTQFSSEAMKKGSNEWNKMTFKPLRELNAEESMDAVVRVRQLKNAIAMEKQQYSKIVVPSDADKQMQALEDASNKIG